MTTTIVPRRLNVLEDAEQLIELFDLVFGHTVTPPMWAWKYRPPWVARDYCWVGEVDGRVVGYIGAVPARGWHDGKEVPFFQLADIMVHPDYRLHYDYFEIAPREIMADLGQTHPDHLLYGFSSHRAFRWFERIGLSGLVERARTRYVGRGGNGAGILEAESGPAATGRFELRDWPWKAPEIDQVWRDQRIDVGTGLIRDTAYLSWRYGGHPINGYRLLGIYEGGDVRGWVIIGNDSPGKKGRAQEIPVVDMLLPESCVQPVLADLAAHVDNPLMLWFPNRLAPEFPDSKDSGTYVYHFVRDSIVDTEYLQNHLYYTMGDVDWW
jgi:hypothetical protein